MNWQAQVGTEIGSHSSSFELHNVSVTKRRANYWHAHTFVFVLYRQHCQLTVIR